MSQDSLSPRSLRLSSAFTLERATYPCPGSKTLERSISAASRVIPCDLWTVMARASLSGICLTLTMISFAFSTDRDSGSAVMIDPSAIFTLGYQVPAWKSMTSPVVPL